MTAVSLIDMPPTPATYFRHVGPYGQSVARFWIERVAPSMAENKLFDRLRFGLAHDDPTITDPAKCRYDGCLVADRKEVLCGQPMRSTLPGGRYAGMRFEGTRRRHRCRVAAFAGRLPTSGPQLDARPMLERYQVDETFDARTGVFDCNLCIPVKPL